MSVASAGRAPVLLAHARDLFPGGVSSPVRAYRAVGGEPPILVRGAGPRVWDVDGREYLDLVGAFGPLILLSLFWRRLSAWGALAGMITGTVVVFLWPLLGTPVYELLPGFVIALVVSVVVSLFTYREDAEIQQEFTDTNTMTLAVQKSEAPAPTATS